MTLGQRLRSLREKKGVTRKQASYESGVSASALEYYETDRAEPTASRIIWLAQYYGVTTDYLLGVDDNG